MSFLGGPECATGSNPLAQFQKQTSADTSLQRDRLTSRQPQQLNGFRTQPGVGPQDGAFQDFAQQRAQFGEQLPTDPLQLKQLRQQQFSNGGGGGGAGGAWAGEFAQAGPQHFSPAAAHAAADVRTRAAGFSPTDFANFRQQQFTPPQQSRSESPAFQSSGFQRPMYGSAFGGGFGMQRPMMYQSSYMNEPPQQQQYEGKGKGKIQELSDTDWEKQFEELSLADKGVEGEELDKEAEEAIERELNQMDRSETGFGDFENIWNGIRQEEADRGREMLADGQLNHFGDEYEQWKDFDSMPQNFDGLRTHDYGMGRDTADYMYEENNPFMDQPNAFEEGQKIVREGGNLSLAALAFEAAARQKPDFVEAWVALGQAQAQNEKETPAIRALEKAIKLDPNNLDALMGLAVSYTNEGFDTIAYRTLERWIGVKYPQLGVTPRGIDQMDEEMGFTDRHLLHERVINLFLEAAQLNPEGGDLDVDVQVGLGVLFYGSEDYDKAVDCFTAALNSVDHGVLKKEGEEHLLWNRLGATLANSGRSEEAIDAYSNALELRSNFVRARYNLGVSCINLGVHEQAAGHLLGALNMHRVIEAEAREKAAELLRDSNGNDADDATVESLLQQNQSTNLYDTLRRVFTQMGRRDLSEQVGPDMNLDAFRGEFDF